MFLILIRLILIECQQLQNLFCNGNFQNSTFTYSFPYLDYNIKSGVINSGSGCWVAQNTTNVPTPRIQVQQVDFAPYSTMVELNGQTNQYYNLCQNFTLQIGYLYNFSFQFGLHSHMDTGTGYMYINSVLVNNVTINSSFLPNSMTVSHLFVPTNTFNVLCVGGDMTLKNPAQYVYNLTILVDNFTLYYVQSKYIQLKFYFSQDYQNNQIVINSSFILPSKCVQYIINNINMAIDGQNYQKITFDYTSQGYLQKKININNFLNYQNIRLQIPNFIITDSFKYYFNIRIIFNRQKKAVLQISNQQMKTIDTISNVGNLTFTTFYNIYSAITVFTCSYFFLDFITFNNLVVLYNFLNLQTQPQFSYLILNNLASIFFENQNKIIKLLQKWFDLKEFNKKEHSLLNNFLNSQNNKQKIQSKRNNFFWFHSYNVTYNFINNNISVFWLFLFLLIKFLFLIILKKIIQHIFNIIFFHSSTLIEIAIVEMLCNCPIMCISIFSNLLDSGYFQPMSKLNFIMQIFLLNIIISLPFLYILVSYHSLKIKIQNIKIKFKNSQNIFHIKDQYFWNVSFQFTRYTLHVIIPCVVFIGNAIGFLTVTSLIIPMICYCYINGFFYFHNYKKLIRGFNLLLLIVHHFSYVIMFVISKWPQIVWSSQILLKICNICGIIIVFTTIIGGIIEMINVFLQFLDQIIIPFSKIIKKIILNWLKKIQQKKQKKILLTLKPNIKRLDQKRKKINQDSAIMIQVTIQDKFNKQKRIKQHVCKKINVFQGIQTDRIKKLANKYVF